VNILTEFGKKILIPNFMKICLAVLELLVTSRKTDVKKPVGAVFATFDLTANC
jgi:hypothetical protein